MGLISFFFFLLLHLSPRNAAWPLPRITSLILLPTTEAFYLPGSNLHKYSDGDFLWVKVNSITSVETELPFGYYTLSFCKPLEGIVDSRKNLGEILMGDRIENSPYRFHTNRNESDIFICSNGPLSAACIR